MKVTGKMTCNMEMELRLGQMDQDMKVIIKKEKNMEREYMCGVMDHNTLGSGLIIRLMVMEYIHG